MDRIKVTMVTNDMNINGISTVIMNYCRGIDKKKFEISILAGKPINQFYIDECAKHEIRLIELPERRKNPLIYYRSLFKALKEIRPKMIHIHCNSAMITPELAIAWLCGVKVRIAHSHNTTCGNKKMHRILYPAFSILCNVRFACGAEAGKWLFRNKDFTVIPNGFDVTRFYFDNSARQRLRRDIGFRDDDFVIGHVGRFNNQKNHPFLLQVFEKVALESTSAKLLLIGNGPNYDTVMELIKSHPFATRITVLGENNDVSKIYSVFDTFVLPSKHEGLGIVLLEAQINGLECVVSDIIPNEAIISDKVTTLSLEADVLDWAKTILNFQNEKRRYEKSKELDERISGYNIDNNIDNLEKIYQGLCR